MRQIERLADLDAKDEPQGTDYGLVVGFYPERPGLRPMTGPAATLGVRDVLRIRDYRRLLGGQAISDIGDGITLLLVLLVINDITGSPLALALMAIAEAIPAFTIGLIAGVYVDRWNRRTVMLAADLLRAVVVIGFAFAAAAELIPVLYVLGFVQASVSTFFRPARGALLPRLVPANGLAARIRWHRGRWSSDGDRSRDCRPDLRHIRLRRGGLWHRRGHLPRLVRVRGADPIGGRCHPAARG